MCIISNVLQMIKDWRYRNARMDWHVQYIYYFDELLLTVLLAGKQVRHPCFWWYHCIYQESGRQWMCHQCCRGQPGFWPAVSLLVVQAHCWLVLLTVQPASSVSPLHPPVIQIYHWCIIDALFANVLRTQHWNIKSPYLLPQALYPRSGAIQRWKQVSSLQWSVPKLLH